MSSNPKSLGKYELQERLGRGGMAEVWKAFDPQLKRYVAIKFVQANLRTDPTFVSRFVREAQAVASLRHPNIIRIYDFETSTTDPEDSMAYMVMDYVEGRTLADYIHTTSALHQFPSASEIIRLFIPICDAIDYAHKHGMVHRDIKPANILLDKHETARNPMGEPILSDFGIVKMIGSSTGTLTSSSVGTPLYISPEQAKGQPGNEASDIYSLGATLYEVCTGVPPFRGDSPFAIMHQHISTPPPAPSLINPSLPPALEAIILRSLAKDPAERFPSAAAMGQALTKSLEQIIGSLDTIEQSTSDERTVLNGPTLSPPVSVPAAENIVATPANAEEMIPTMLMSSGDRNPSTPIPTQAELPDATIAARTPALTPASSPPPPPSNAPRRTRWPNRRLLVALIVLIVVVVGGSVLGTLLVLSNRSHQQTQTSASVIVGQGFFTSSGQSAGPNNPGINDTFQVQLTHIAAPPSGKTYYGWLLPDTIQSEAASISLGPLSITNGNASLATAYTDPQHANLLASFSRFLVTEEATNPPPQSYSLDKTAWRYYAEVPQTPASRDCTSSLNQLSDLCHVRHLLAVDPELQQVGLPNGLSYWFLNNVEEIQKWAREAVDHNAAVDIRHKVVDILTMLAGMTCIQQDLSQAAPGASNMPDDGTLAKVAVIPLLNCALTPTQPGYLEHIHNHLNAIVQSPGVLPNQADLAKQVGTELNTVNALITQLHSDALKLVAMPDAQLTQQNGLGLRTELDALATHILSGGTNANTGAQDPGVTQIADQIQQLATLDVKAYTGTP